jgi:hypothetical protein
MSLSKAPWWRCLHCGCDEYEEHVFTGHLRGLPMIRCANCKVLHSQPDPKSNAALRWKARKLSEALMCLLELQDFHDDRPHWESEHKLGNGAAWRVLTAMDALAASGIETEGHDRETGHGAKHESPTLKGGRP